MYYCISEVIQLEGEHMDAVFNNSVPIYLQIVSEIKKQKKNKKCNRRYKRRNNNS